MSPPQGGGKKLLTTDYWLRRPLKGGGEKAKHLGNVFVGDNTRPPLILTPKFNRTLSPVQPLSAAAVRANGLK